MATIREHVRIAASPQKVWDTVREPLGLLDWFPGIEKAEMVGNARRIDTMGIVIVEDIVTIDDDLRRFQYRISEAPVPVEFHLATIDVIEDGDGSLLVYSCDVEPDDMGAILAPVIAGAAQNLKTYCEA